MTVQVEIYVKNSAGEDFVKRNLFVLCLFLCFLNACIGGFGEETNTFALGDSDASEYTSTSSSMSGVSQAGPQSVEQSSANVDVSSSDTSPDVPPLSSSSVAPDVGNESSESKEPPESSSAKSGNPAMSSNSGEPAGAVSSNSNVPVGAASSNSEKSSSSSRDDKGPMGSADTSSSKDSTNIPTAIRTTYGVAGSCVKYVRAGVVFVKLTYSGWFVEKSYTDKGTGFAVVNTYNGIDSARIMNVCGSYKGNDAYRQVSCDASAMTISYEMSYEKVGNLDEYCNEFVNLEITELEILYGEF